MGHVVSLKKTVTSVSIMIASSKVTMMMATGLPRLRMIPKSAPQKIVLTVTDHSQLHISVKPMITKQKFTITTKIKVTVKNYLEEIR